MRRIAIFTAAALLAGVITISCSDDDDKNGKGMFLFDETEFQATNGSQYYYGVAHGGLRVVGVDVWDPATRFTIVFDIYTENDKKLAAGFYPYSKDEEVNTFSNGWVLFDTKTSSEEHMINGGTIEVVDSGGSYTINIDCTTVSGRVIKGRYTGALKWKDYSH